MSFVYTPGIPSGTDIPAQSAPLFAANFSYINTMVNRDHFMTRDTANSNDGTHRQVTLTNEAAPGFSGGNAALYSQLIAGDSWPTWQNTGSSNVLFSVDPKISGNGYTGLPGISTAGAIIQWGNVASTGGSGTVTFATSNIAFTTSCYMVIASLYYETTAPTSSSGQYVTIDKDTLSNTKFDWTVVASSSAIKGFYWLAIGK